MFIHGYRYTWYIVCFVHVYQFFSDRFTGLMNTKQVSTKSMKWLRLLAAAAVLVAASGADEDAHAEGGHEAHEAHEGHDGDEGHEEGHDEAHGDHEEGHAEGGDHEAHEEGHADEDHGEEKK